MRERTKAHWLLAFFFVALPIVVLLVTMAGCSTTSSYSPSTHGTVLPPPEYDYPNPNIKTYWMSEQEIAEKCGHMAAAACAFYTPGAENCFIFLHYDMPEGGAYWRHERGHCNGWPDHHPT